MAFHFFETAGLKKLILERSRYHKSGRLGNHNHRAFGCGEWEFHHARICAQRRILRQFSNV
jgi:hypothetical protein